MNFTLPGHLLCIDVEATGTNMSKHNICQIGVALVDTKLNIVDKYSSIIKPFSSDRDPDAMRVHNISEEVLAQSRSFNEVMIELESKLGVNPKRYTLAAWGTHFDIIFLREEYKKFNRVYPFSYRCFDLKSAAIWSASCLGMSVGFGGISKYCKKLGISFEGTKHDALADILNSIYILQTFKKEFDKRWVI